MSIFRYNYAGVALFLLASSVFAERPWPEKSYDCQVETRSGVRGLVSIQTFSLDDAKKGALGKQALTTLGGRDTSVSITECVEVGKTKFSDTSFQHWRERLEG